jgi:hypothetical protein
MEFVVQMLILPLFLAYAAAIVLALDRWGRRGVLVVLAIPVVTNLVWGTITWWPQHEEVSAIVSRSQDWFCHTANLSPPAVLVGLAALAGVRFSWAPRRGARIASAFLFAATAVFMLLVPMIWWVIGVLGCDTL